MENLHNFQLAYGSNHPDSWPLGETNKTKRKRMKIKTLRTLVAAVMLLGSLFFVQADDKKEGYDKREAKFNAFEKEIWGAVKAGKLSKEDAQKKLAGLKKEIWGGDLKKDSGDKKGSGDKKVETLRRQLEALKRENEGLRKRLKERKDR